MPDAHLGLLDDMDHEAKINSDAEYRESELRIQALGAAISRRDWHAAEQAYAAIRDKFYSHKRAGAQASAGIVAAPDTATEQVQELAARNAFDVLRDSLMGAKANLDMVLEQPTINEYDRPNVERARERLRVALELTKRSL